jgi:uncharacterized protein (UPF0303 family)
MYKNYKKSFEAATPTTVSNPKWFRRTRKIASLLTGMSYVFSKPQDSNSKGGLKRKRKHLKTKRKHFNNVLRKM